MKIQIAAVLFLGLASFSNKVMASPISCNVRQSSYNCLLCNCYHETRGESTNGKVAVAKVVLSRAESDEYPNGICKVVYQRSQFSWTNDRINNNINATKAEDIASLDECKSAINTALHEGSNGVLYYYNPSAAQPKWARAFTLCGRVENHVFLTPKGTKCPKKLGSNGKSGSSSNQGNKKHREGAR
ncbi:MAG: cell wall hydrolase [Bdellovibrio sp.]